MNSHSNSLTTIKVIGNGCNLFVGDIPRTLGDHFLRFLIGKCGEVVHWNRAMDGLEYKKFCICTLGL